MHTIVIGAGVVGMATAYYLHREGHRVSVVDASPGPGLATSRANGAQLSYSFVAPLADPAVLPKLPAWLLGRDTPLRWRPRLDPAQWRWCLDFLRACTRGKSRATTRELLALGLYSRQCVHELVGRERPDFDFSSRGKLLVYQDAAAYGRALAQMDYQATLGCEQRALDRQACLDLEPALADIGASIAGAIYTPTEDAGDCLRLCTELERLLRATPGPVDFTSTRRSRRCAARTAASSRWTRRGASCGPTTTCWPAASAPRRWRAASDWTCASIRSRATA